MKVKYLLFVVVLFIACDPGGPLVLEDGSFSKQVYIDSTLVQFSIFTLGNIDFSLRAEVFTEDSVTIFLDSMKVYVNNNPIEYSIYATQNKKPVVRLQLAKDKFISYGFRCRHQFLKRGDIITILANDYIEKNGKLFNLKPIHFFIRREY